MKLGIHGSRILIDRFVSSLATIVAQTAAIRQRRTALFVNPAAGGIVKRHDLVECVQAIEAFAAGLHGRTVAPVDIEVFYTDGPGHARRLAADFLAEETDAPLLAISAGGDGTHGEVMAALTEADVPENTLALRLPMGTGNDGADAPTIAEACGLLTFGHSTLGVPYVRVTDAKDQTHLAFNIASMGLDAYVTDVGNKLKRLVPGDIYKVIADVATLFYEPIFGIEPATLEVESGEKDPESILGRYIIIAFGASGHRCYGDGKPVLPGNENICAIETVGIRRKLQVKSLLYQGKHIDQPEVTMRSGTRLRVSYPGKMPLQLDGEAVWLLPEDFPITLEVCEAPISRLTMAGR